MTFEKLAKGERLRKKIVAIRSTLELREDIRKNRKSKHDIIYDVIRNNNLDQLEDIVGERAYDDFSDLIAVNLERRLRTLEAEFEAL